MPEQSTPQFKPTIERKPSVRHRTGYANSTLYSKISEGLFVPPISLGARAVGWLEHEVTTIIMARAAGKDDDEIRQLVRDLVSLRRLEA